MNAKGYNNRCILGWLADCLAIVVKRDIPADRFVGAWIQSQVNANNMTWPMHEMLEPSAVCLTLGLCNDKALPNSFHGISIWTKIMVPTFNINPHAFPSTIFHHSQAQGCTQPDVFDDGVIWEIPVTRFGQWILDHKSNVHVLKIRFFY